MINFLFVLYIVAILIIVFFLALLFGEVKKSKLAQSLALLFILIGFWITLEFFAVFINFENEINTLLWKVIIIIVYLASFSVLNLSLVIAQKTFKKSIKISLWLLIIFFIFITFFTDKVILQADFNKTGWGYSFVPGDWFGFSIIFYSILLLPAIFISFKYFFQEKEDKKRKKSSLVFGFAILIMMSTAFLTNGLLPLLGIPFPKLAALGAFFSVLFFFYAIYKWNVFNVGLGRFRIKNKIFLIWFVAGGIFIILGISIFYFFSVSLTEELIYKNLQTNTQIKKAWFNSYLDEKKSNLEMLSEASLVKNIFANHEIGKTDVAMRAIENKARIIAEEVKEYLAEHPQKTIKDLQADSQFQNIAVQPVGLTGYSALTDSKTLIARFHANPNIVDLKLEKLSEDFPNFWNIMVASKGGVESSGFYEWKDESGKIREKFMYIVPVQGKTADGVELTVAATTYLDEYSSTAKILKDSDIFLKKFIKIHDYDNLFIINNKGIILWQGRKRGHEDVGVDISLDFFPDNYLKQAYQETSQHPGFFISDFEFYEDNKAPVFYLANSVFSEVNNQFIGSLIIQANAEQIDKVLQNRFGLGETGETYLVGSDYLMRSDSAFIDYSTVLNLEVKTKGAFDCFRNKNKEVKVSKYNNYLGQSVLGSYVYLPPNNECLLSEIREEEALAPINRIWIVTIIIGLVFIFLVFLISSWLGKIISKPIIRLREKIKIIEKGNLDYKVDLKTNDEVGELSRAFDKMTEAIKKSRKDIHEKVQQQTEEIIQSREMMEDQQKAVLNVLEDVEEEKENVSKEKDKIDAILHSIGDGVFVLDEKYNIVMVNQVTSDISGFSKEELVGKKYDEVLKFVFEKDGKANNGFIADVIEKGVSRKMSNHTLLIHKNGEKIPVADSSSPLKNKNNEVIGCVVVFRNVEKERQIDKAKTEFVSLASHQLLTPLTSIGWYTEMLIEGDAGKLTKKQKEFLDQIYEGNNRMVDLVNSLLSVSRIELGTFSVEPEPIVFSKISNSIIKEMQPNVKEKKMKIITNYPQKEPKINADSKLVRIIFQNLISNAVKYTQPGGEIRVNISIEKPNIVINVTDNGYGIPHNQQNKIFQKLFRADNVRAKDTTGTGLGLYIVKSIVDQAKGEISFKSQQKKGTTFTVKMPLSGMKPVAGTKKLQ